MNISFIGLGIMGSRMAKNLLDNGVKLTVYNRSQEPVRELEAAGAKAADNYRDAVQGADIVFTMLATPEVVEEVVLDGDQGCLANMEKGSLWVDCSTVNPSFSRRCAKVAEQNGIEFLGAPVAGTKPTAEAGELAFFGGGAEEQLEKVRPYMEHMGAKIIHFGGPDAGASYKMLVNGMLAQSMLIFSEAVILGEKMGLDRDMLLDNIPNLPVIAPFTKAKAKMIREDDYEVQFPLEWMQKDLHLMALSAYEQGQPLLLANLAKEVYGQAKAAGLAREDFAAVHRFLEGKA